MPTVVLAPDKFKGSLTAADVARHLQIGVHAVQPDAEIRIIPVADGGEGTTAAAVSSGYSALVVPVSGPYGQVVDAVLAVRGELAVVELAQASGLQLVPPAGRDALRASSYGTGELIRAALDAGCTTVVLGLGGSASTDGGAGLIQALGARLIDGGGLEIARGGGGLGRLDALDLTALDPRVARTTFVIAGDVDNPLDGPNGAAEVFAPQKGASSGDVAELARGLAHWGRAVAATIGRDLSGVAGAGAAGGAGFAALALLQARSRSGIDVVLDLVGFDEQVAGARLVVTGEGSLDEQSLGGKAPVGVARRARALGVEVVAVAGRTTLSEAARVGAGFATTYALTDLEPDPERCMSEAGALLERIGGGLARDWLA